MSNADWISYEEAYARGLAAVTPLATETVPLTEALGRALAEPVSARVPHPPWDNSAMDGFAVYERDVLGATEETPIVLPISQEIPAGKFPRGPLEERSAARVMTGAPVPEGATGVIRIEHTDGGSANKVLIFNDADRKRHIRLTGEDTPAGATLLQAGEEIGSAATALLAMAGCSHVAVVRRPRVGVLANGDELAGLENYAEVLSGQKIMNSNGYALAAQLESAGAAPTMLGIARDNPKDLRRYLREYENFDALVSAAGVSVGDHDYVKSVLDELDFERSFWRVRMRPGSATLFGSLNNRPFWGVPGNPVSALVTFEVLVRPAIRRMAGYARHTRRLIRCRTSEEIRGPENVVTFLRVQIDEEGSGHPVTRLAGTQGSGILTSMLADGLLVLPEGTSSVKKGESVQVMPLREWARSA